MTDAERELKRTCFELYKRGAYPVTPLNGKAPVQDNWTQTTFDPNIDFNMFSNRNFGVVLSATDIVIDVDPRNYAPNDDPLARLVKDFGFTPEDLDTFVVRTGSGGVHLYYRKGDAVHTRGKLKEYPGLDFKSRGGQVVGAGCIHPETGAQYTVCRGSPERIRTIPTSLLRRLETGRIVQETIKPAAGTCTDDEGSKARFTDYLKFHAPYAVEGQNGNDHTYVVACKGRDLGLSLEVTYELMSEIWNDMNQPPWSEEELHDLVTHAYTYAVKPAGCNDASQDFKEPSPDHVPLGEDFDKAVVEKAEEISKWTAEAQWDLGRKSEILHNLHNTVTMISHPIHGIAGCVKLNEMSGNVEIWKMLPWSKDKEVVGTGWTDNDNVHLKYMLAHTLKYEVSVRLLSEAITILASRSSYHPVRDWLKSLVWDGKERIDTWLIECGGCEDTRYVRAVSRKTLLGAVARVIVPGIKWDYMPVLEGKQGIGKSSLVSILGGEFYADISLDPHNKDTVQAMLGKWILEVSEMECTKRAEVQALKGFVSRQVDRIRLPFAALTKDFKRQSIFIGTVNPSGSHSYLKDTTGNRRFWPVYLRGRVKFQLLKSIREQLFAEAYYKFINGKEKLYLDEENLEQDATHEQQYRCDVDPWLDIIDEWMSRHPELIDVTISEVWTGAFTESPTRLGRLESGRIADALKELGWSRDSHLVRRCRQVTGFKKKKEKEEE